MGGREFETSVFINCPFDAAYEPILQSILFCVTYLGLVPRIATERIDSGESRLHKIQGLIEASRYSIHDLSRAQAKRRGEYYRLNMPFELGIDYACRLYGGSEMALKKILILEEKPYRYQASLSDLAGCDIAIHHADFQQAVRKVRNWLVNEAPTERIPASRILARYVDFQGWHYEKQLNAGFSEDDIQDYPTYELMRSMSDWMELGQPV